MDGSPVTTSAPRMVRAARRERVETTPLWFMRQAGRALPEYRAVKEHHTLYEITRQPELCAEVTLQPVRRLGVDAAILYSDITVPLVATGIEIELVEGVGPTLARPLRTQADIGAIRVLEPAADIPHVIETVELLRHELDGTDTALIGFVGAPFTLAGYLVEGKPSRDFAETKRLMYGEPALWGMLMDRLTDTAIRYAQAQIAAGAQVIQVFDSWVGCLSPRDYTRCVQPYMRRLFGALTPPEVPEPVPVIHFGTGTATLLEAMATAGGDVIGLDWRISLGDGWARLGGPDRVAIQGNLDPAVLTAPWPVVEHEAAHVMRQASGQPGYIFNLGHGVLPSTKPETLERLVEFVHTFDPQSPSSSGVLAWPSGGNRA